MRTGYKTLIQKKKIISNQQWKQLNQGLYSEAKFSVQFNCFCLRKCSDPCENCVPDRHTRETCLCTLVATSRRGYIINIQPSRRHDVKLDLMYHTDRGKGCAVLLLTLSYWSQTLHHPSLAEMEGDFPSLAVVILLEGKVLLGPSLCSQEAL